MNVCLNVFAADSLKALNFRYRQVLIFWYPIQWILNQAIDMTLVIESDLSPSLLETDETVQLLSLSQGNSTSVCMRFTVPVCHCCNSHE